jgi:hypothetical protein
VQAERADQARERIFRSETPAQSRRKTALDGGIGEDDLRAGLTSPFVQRPGRALRGNVEGSQAILRLCGGRRDHGHSERDPPPARRYAT